MLYIIYSAHFDMNYRAKHGSVGAEHAAFHVKFSVVSVDSGSNTAGASGDCSHAGVRTGWCSYSE